MEQLLIAVCENMVRQLRYVPTGRHVFNLGALIDRDVQGVI